MERPAQPCSQAEGRKWVVRLGQRLPEDVRGVSPQTTHFPAVPAAGGAELRPPPGPLGAGFQPHSGPLGGRGSGLTLGPLLTLRLTPHRADLLAPGSQAEGSRLQACLTRSGQRWGEGGGPAKKRCPARQPLVSTPWLPATGPGTPPREGCPRRPGHCWGAAPRGSGCSSPYTGSRAACPP